MSIERPIEVELKYRLPDLARGERLLAAEVIGPFRATGAAPSLQFEDQYLDTRDGALARAGFAARLRHIASTKWGTRRYLAMDTLLHPVQEEAATA